MTEIEDLKARIGEEMQAWAALFIENRVAFLRSRKIEASGDLIRSMEAEINRQARAEAVELLLDFEEHGRFLDMRRLKTPQGGGDFILALVEWIKKKGFADRFTQRYMERNKPKKTYTKIPANVLNKIAWGIAVTRADGKFRRRRWYNKAKTGSIGKLFNQVAGIIPDIVAEQIKKNLQTPIA